MIGSKQLIIDGKDFETGMASSLYSKDGLFSNSNLFGINIATVPGVLYSQSPSSDISPSSSGVFIASASNSSQSGGFTKYFVTRADGNNANFYAYNGSSLTLQYGLSGKEYDFANTDLVVFKQYLYATSSTDIAQFVVGNVDGSLSSPINNWWTTTGVVQASLSNVTRHPMLVFEDNLWIADKEKIHKYDGANKTNGALLLTSDQYITALGIENGSGKMLIATTQGMNASSTLSKVNKILIWDGFSNKPLRSVQVEEMVTAFQNVNGTIFIFYGQNLGYWNGSGITFLRRLKNVTLNANSLPYKHHTCVIGNALYFIDGTSVMAYEAIRGGVPKVFYPAWGQFTGQPAQVETLTLISDLGSGNLGISFTFLPSGNNYFFKYGTRTVAKGTVSSTAIETRIFDFNTKIRIKSIKISFADAIAIAKSPISLILNDYDNYLNVAFSVTENPLNNSIVGQLTYLPRSNNLKEMDSFSLLISDGYTSTFSGIRKIVIYYDTVE